MPLQIQYPWVVQHALSPLSYGCIQEVCWAKKKHKSKLRQWSKAALPPQVHSKPSKFIYKLVVHSGNISHLSYNIISAGLPPFLLTFSVWWHFSADNTCIITEKSEQMFSIWPLGIAHGIWLTGQFVNLTSRNWWQSSTKISHGNCHGSCDHHPCHIVSYQQVLK